MRQPVVFGKYLLLERISVGGMAEVFKAKAFGEEGFEKILAIKRILPSMAEDEEFIQMFIDEAKISGQLSHPNIGQIYELGRIADSHFIAMEFVWGKDVLQIQNRFRRLRQKMPLAMSAYIASRVCEALDYAHRKKDEQGRPLNIIHRDVSPQNVLVSYSGEVKLIDFGIARARSRSSKTQAGVLKGKFGYMSPEQVRALPLDHRSDVFAVGTLLYEMTTGERLFTGESDFATLEKVRNSLVPKPSRVDPRIPPELEAIIQRALHRDADERYQWATEMHEELAAFLMTQNPIFTVKTLANTMAKLFEAERRREEAALEQYRELRPDDLERFVAPPESRKGVVSLLGHVAPEADAAAADEGPDEGATQIGAPSFDEGAAGPIEVIASGELEEVHEELKEGEGSEDSEAHEEEARKTQIYNELVQASMAGPTGSGQALTSEPTFIFNVESGKLVQLAEQSTVIFSQSKGNGEGIHGELPDQGPTVIFDQGLSGALAKSSSLPAPHDVGVTMPVTLGPRGSVVKDVLIGVLVALLLISGVVLWKVASSQGDRGSSLATLVITTNPPRAAEVFIDGQSRGQMQAGMPMTLKDMEPREYRVSIKSPKALPAESLVALTPGGVRVLNLTLVSEETGYLSLQVDPAGAEVFLDGAEVSASSLSTPLEIRAGTPHEIRVHKEGYAPATEMVEVKAGEKVSLKLKLLPGKVPPGRGSPGKKVSTSGGAAGAGRLEPKGGAPSSGASLLEDKGEPTTGAPSSGRSRGEGGPKSGSTSGGLSQGEPKRGSSASRSGEAKAPPKGGSSASHSGEGKVQPKISSSASQGGEVKGPPKSGSSASPGGEVKGPPKSASIVAPEDNSGGASASADAMGYLIANTTPWAKVLVDGEDTGKTTPVAPRSKIPLKPGRHKVTFEVNGKQFHFPVVITAGQMSRLIKKLPVE